MERDITFSGFGKLIFIKIALKERYFKLQSKLAPAARSMNSNFFPHKETANIAITFTIIFNQAFLGKMSHAFKFHQLLLSCCPFIFVNQYLDTNSTN